MIGLKHKNICHRKQVRQSVASGIRYELKILGSGPIEYLSLDLFPEAIDLGNRH